LGTIFLTLLFPGLRDATRCGVVAITCAIVFALFCPNTLALNPDWQLYQYGHRAWKADDGFLGGFVNAIVQDTQGYLWVGTDNGLFRFDGVRVRRWSPPDGSRLADLIFRFLAGKDGGILIGTTDGLIHWNGQRVTGYKSHKGAFIASLSQDINGTVWFTPVQLTSDNDDTLCGVTNEKMVCYGKKDGLHIPT